MLDYFSKTLKKKKGFTLVELMVVVAIIGILVAIAVPVYNNVTDKAAKKAVEANLRTIDSAIMQYLVVDESGDAPDEAALTADYLQTWPEGPSGVASYEVTASKPYQAQVTFDGTGVGGLKDVSKTLENLLDPTSGW